MDLQGQSVGIWGRDSAGHQFIVEALVGQNWQPIHVATADDILRLWPPCIVWHSPPLDDHVFAMDYQALADRPYGPLAMLILYPPWYIVPYSQRSWRSRLWFDDFLSFPYDQEEEELVFRLQRMMRRVLNHRTR